MLAGVSPRAGVQGLETGFREGRRGGNSWGVRGLESRDEGGIAGWDVERGRSCWRKC